MAQKTLQEFSAPSLENIPTGPRFAVEEGIPEFELRSSLINLVQATQFSGKAHEDASAHLQNFLEIGSTIHINGVDKDVILLRLFPFSLEGKARKWFYTHQDNINNWTNLSDAFLSKFFPIGKTTALRGNIVSFQQQKTEAISEAWERFQGYISDCPHHGMATWLLMQTFYHGLTQKARECLDASAKGSFLELTTGKAEILLDKIAENQSWFQDKAQHCHQTEEIPEEVNALSTKMENLLHWIDQRAKFKEDQRAIETAYKYQPTSSQPNSKGMNSGNTFKQLSLKEIIAQQTKINDEVKQRLDTNESSLKDIHNKMDFLLTAFDEQNTLNKRVELKLIKIAAALPVATNIEQIKNITTRGGKATRDPPYPKEKQRTSAPVQPAVIEEESPVEAEDLLQPPRTREMRKDFYDTNYLPFPRRNRGLQSDEQFGKFVEVIQKLYVNIPLLDAIQVPTYAKYIRDILNKKRPLPTTEVIKLTEECSAAILNKPPKKKEDPGCPTIDCSIRKQHFNSALCDLGASVSVMPASFYKKLEHATLEPTSMCLQLADQSVRHPLGITENIPVKIRDFLVPVDFVVLDMSPDSKVSIILGRPFLSTANAHIDVGKGEIKFNINGQEEHFTFKPRPKRDSTVKEVHEELLKTPSPEEGN